MTNVAVTFPAGSEQREILVDTLGPIAHIAFVSDLSPEERTNELSVADVLFSWSPNRELQPDDYKAIMRARMMQLLSAGADHVPFSRLPSSLIIATNAGAYAEPMAEHILAMILATTKNLFDKHKKLTKGVFDQSNPNRMLRGSSCAILGYGGIGKATARLLRCFGVKIYALNTTGKTTEPVEFIGTLKDLGHVLPLADIVVIALPLTNSTRGLIGIPPPYSSSLYRLIFLNNIGHFWNPTRILVWIPFVGAYNLGYELLLNAVVIGAVASFTTLTRSAAYTIAGLTPHGIFEIPAFILEFAGLTRWQISTTRALYSKLSGRHVDRPLLVEGIKDTLVLSFFSVVLFAIAAYVETYFTPRLLGL
jgi:uncharacterized membrane protein SpoIIM required for sporulation